MRWATEDDLSGTGAVTAPDETFMVKVGDDVGRCAAKFFRDKAHLRDVIEGLVSSGNRVWLYVPLHDCNYQHRTNEIVACLCLRGPEGSEPDIAAAMDEYVVGLREALAFYADDSHYNENGAPGHYDWDPDNIDNWAQDRGDIAREALAAMQAEDGEEKDT